LVFFLSYTKHKTNVVWRIMLQTMKVWGFYKKDDFRV
jgi:hypothetical protein